MKGGAVAPKDVLKKCRIKINEELAETVAKAQNQSQIYSGVIKKCLKCFKGFKLRNSLK